MDLEHGRQDPRISLEELRIESPEPRDCKDETRTLTPSSEPAQTLNPRLLRPQPQILNP